jgi:hypothetical protein
MSRYIKRSRRRLVLLDPSSVLAAPPEPPFLASGGLCGSILAECADDPRAVLLCHGSSDGLVVAGAGLPVLLPGCLELGEQGGEVRHRA